MGARSFTVVVNPAAGGAAAVHPLARRLRDAGADVAVEHTRGLAHAAELARTAAGAGRVALAAGGDGMAGAVGGALAGTGSVFGIVPAGRGNDFARQLGIPAAPDALAPLLLTGAPRAVDAIEADGVPVLGSVYAGVDAVAGRHANRSRLLRGSASYYAGALRAVLGWRPADYRVTVDGVEYRERGYTVVAANSGYYGFGRRIAPDARVDDGLLDVVIVGDGPKTMFFSVMRELADGSHVHRPQVRVVRGREVRIEAARALPYGADGELPGTLPVTVRVLPGALTILAP
ncbi:diacylglycerol kinase family protein [Actinomadura rayongensis]|uniref:Diacylglycerol kinase family lipid kinase n=1 Tax=Actinomadura rayongensis TaxID=1429076 RepID=A0A6I4WEE6_9ACTN|nr:diacylglycerol kinase family protein [Actinomadura rayongensis]MXQ66226.1 diacylglycerol kinase family lipid kinase [Actinomadura rayongensis]